MGIFLLSGVCLPWRPRGREREPGVRDTRNRSTTLPSHTSCTTSPSTYQSRYLQSHTYSRTRAVCDDEISRDGHVADEHIYIGRVASRRRPFRVGSARPSASDVCETDESARRSPICAPVACRAGMDALLVDEMSAVRQSAVCRIYVAHDRKDGEGGKEGGGS